MAAKSSRAARYLLATAVFVLFGVGIFAAERWIEAHDPALLWRDPVSGDDGLKFYRFHPRVGLFHKPGFSADYQGVTYSQNSLGARGPEIRHARRAGVPRVLLLGDSVTWGFGVADSETMAVALAERFSEAEVVNLGVAGFGTAQELVLLREEGLAYQPDHVVLVFTLANDVEDTWLPDSAAAYPANIFFLDPAVPGGLGFVPFDLSPGERLGLWLRHNSYLVAWAVQATSAPGVAARAGGGDRRRTSIERANHERLDRVQPDLRRYARRRELRPRDRVEPHHFARRGGLLLPTALNHYKLDLTLALIAAMRDLCREAGADFSVVVAPFLGMLEQSSPLYANPLRRELLRFLEEEQIDVVDLLPTFMTGAGGGRVFVDSMHFSPAGNRIAAEQLARSISLPEG